MLQLPHLLFRCCWKILEVHLLSDDCGPVTWGKSAPAKGDFQHHNTVVFVVPEWMEVQ